MTHNNSCFSWYKISKCDGQFAMTKINEAHLSWPANAKISLPEEAIGKCDSGSLIDESCALDSSNITCIKICLSL
jgi:hypothetical protein